jgi:hypothetical protein
MGRLQWFVTEVDLLGMLDFLAVSEVYLAHTMFRELAVYPSSRHYYLLYRRIFILRLVENVGLEPGIF